MLFSFALPPGMPKSPDISRSQKKRDSTAMQMLGEELATLSGPAVKSLNLPDAVTAALADLQRFSSNEARRRQMQFIGRLLREETQHDVLSRQLENLRAPQQAATEKLHALEALRNKLLLASDHSLEEELRSVAGQLPGASLTRLRHLASIARQELAKNSPKKAYRELFRYVRQFAAFLFFAALALAAACPSPAAPASSCEEAAKPLLAVLARAYPQLSGNLVCSDSGAAFFQPASHASRPILLVPAQGSEESAADASFRATLALPYPAGAGRRYPEKGFDPGRTRSTALLKALYGADAKEVRENCEYIEFFGAQLLFNSRHGAADALRRAVRRLEHHLAAHPDDAAYVLPSAGTFVWRPVQDTGLLSAHAFGAAIDLNAEKGVYWLWKPSPAMLEHARKRYPQGIVDAFEAEGFIWGGKWASFDFMHFEYRPELFPDPSRKK